MKYLLLLPLFLVSVCCKAQLAIINDPDGYVNVRKGQNINTEIVGKLYEGQLFFFGSEVDGQPKWFRIFRSGYNQINYADGNITFKPNINSKRDYIEGYVYTDRILPLDKLPRIKVSAKAKYLSANKLVLKNDSISLVITIRPFIIKNHKVNKEKDDCSNCSTNWVDKIDGKIPKGVDGDLPKVEVSHVSFSINDQIIEMPSSCYNDLYQPNLERVNIFFGKKGDIYIYFEGGDGAGSYEIVWVIKNRRLVQRYFDNSIS